MTELPFLQKPETAREKILVAAANKFSAKGFASTTTKEIAEDAGVNEVTIFRIFKTKQNILESIIQKYSGLPDLLQMMQGRFSGNLEEDLLILSKTFHMIFMERADAIRLLLCEASRFEGLQNVMSKIPEQLTSTLAVVFEKHISEGSIKEFDPRLMAQAFFGFYFSLGITRNILQNSIVNDMPEDEIFRQFVELFLSGIQQE
ncbi:MAG: TetR/AcrR family transcriptional regulator [Anaerolineaceae bacterium]|nr:TetR/AcrR family transcriptional regulator [Anaerolineaceae bacterium]